MRYCLFFIMLFGVVFSAAAGESVRKGTGPQTGELWRALHVIGHDDDTALDKLAPQIPKLAKAGINVLIFEVTYHFDFQSHPELRYGAKNITKVGARKLAALCREQNIRLIPLFNCIGHQSWEKETFPLLRIYPQFDTTPGTFPDNAGDKNNFFYCREWDITNPKIYTIVYELMDEILDAFQADAMHVGMDEIFMIGSKHSPSTNGKDPATLFAKAIVDIHGYLTKKKQVEMLMWADRLIDPKLGFGKYESSHIGTASAVDLIPRDIILLPWHYSARETYPSIPHLLGKGFRVLPASWNKVDAAKALIAYSLAQNHPKMLGHTFTVWAPKDYTLFKPMTENLPALLGPPKSPKNGQAKPDR